MSYIQKLLEKIVQLCAPTGMIMPFGGTTPPEGWILVQNVKVYQDEYSRLYTVLSASSHLEKGADTDGRAWVKMVNPEGRAIQCTTSGSLVWQLLEPQLPNIVGQTTYGVFQGSAPNGFQGALYYTGRNGTGNIISGGNYWTAIGLDASKSNATYSGTNVQQSALQVLCCIKI